MIRRREFMFASFAAALLPGAVAAASRVPASLPWPDFDAAMQQLASAWTDRTISQADMAAQGIQLLRQLETTGPAWQAAIEAAWESGNRFWLWQRLTRKDDINGGVLTIEQGQDVPLHDHPGATGMVRVLAGELEVWQFDRTKTTKTVEADSPAVLERVMHRVLRSGDTAVLSPQRGNIHALRARSKTCSMLDYFIPPYVRRERTWYEPLDSNWHNSPRISCRCIAENDFYMS